MRASELIAQLQRLQSKFGDLEVAVDVVSETQVFELTDLVEYDNFEPGHPGYFVVEAGQDI
jgi:hypothetical protein